MAATATAMAETLTQLGSSIGGLMVAYAMFLNFFPHHHLTTALKRYFTKLINFYNPYIHITFPEFQSDGYQRSKAYDAIKRYLNAHSSSQAKHLHATLLPDTDALVLTMATNRDEVTDHFNGVKLRWSSWSIPPSTRTISLGPREADKKYFTLTFHGRHRHTICDHYVKHVLDEGKAITVKERRRKLFTNVRDFDSSFSPRRKLWTEVVFDHPATFHTLAMDPVEKKEIIDDLINFSESKDYYKSVGKAWKRGYLLYGPPGTGKSTMIAAMANLLEYDVYDLELTAVKDNTELRKLLIGTSGKSIIVVEDIDCSLGLTGQREINSGKLGDCDEKNKKKEEEKKDPIKEKLKKLEEKKASEVTLSGLLNFIDGLWSACGGERIIVFTTNYVEKLDPALIRRGRMDKHIHLSYCGYEAFKVLAKNYLNFEEHELFEKIRQLLQEKEMTPADVAENLMPKVKGEESETCLIRLVKALEKGKEEDSCTGTAIAEAEEDKKSEEEEEEEEAEKSRTKQME